MKNIQLVVIDPQNSFCRVVPESDQQQMHDGELCVPGGWDDMRRVGDLITRLDGELAGIKVTMDGHQRLHVSHPDWFRDSNGNKPNPFTFMRAENGSIIGSVMQPDCHPPVFVDVGNFQTILFELSDFKKPYCPQFGYDEAHANDDNTFYKTYNYLTELQEISGYQLGNHCLWPPHCLIGTPGHNIVDPLYEAIDNWCSRNSNTIDITMKGSNPWVEHFSAVRAEVADPDDPETELNTAFITTLMEADEILFSGEARSHCLAKTVRDCANEFVAGGSLGTSDEFIKKCVLLSDATSDVPGFENYGEDFVNEMTDRGMKTSTCADYLP